MKGFILGVISVLIIGGVGFAAYQYGKKSSVSNVVPTATELSTPISTPAPVANDSDLIKTALFKKNGWPDDNSITVKVDTNDGTYASGTAGGQGGGGYFYAIKVAGEWKIVADGNGEISCASLAPYPDYPKSLIPMCFDDSTQKNINR